MWPVTRRLAYVVVKYSSGRVLAIGQSTTVWHPPREINRDVVGRISFISRDRDVDEIHFYYSN